MEKCKKCSKEKIKLLYKCPDCGAKFCEICAKENKQICPFCYSTVDFN